MPAPRALRLAALALALVVLVLPSAVEAQAVPLRGGAGVVRGVVLAGPDDPVPYGVVALQPRFPQRFTDAAGAFAFTHVPAGTYHLLARQVGFKPLDTTVVVAADAQVVVNVTLERLTVELEAITVVAAQGCTQPGPPDASAPELAALFEQLRESAQQYKLLATTYQFRYRMARTFTDLDEVGNRLARTVDTVSYLSSALVHYRPGDVVGTATLPDGSAAPAVVLPTLTDLADSVFQAHHCFTFAGRVPQDGAEVLRFHFRPPEGLAVPDLEGDVDLDPGTYQIRRASVSLTHAELAQTGVRAASSTITFAEVLPNIVVQKRVVSVEELTAPPLRSGAKYVARYVEDQTLAGVTFLHPLPGAQPAAP